MEEKFVSQTRQGDLNSGGAKASHGPDKKVCVRDRAAGLFRLRMDNFGTRMTKGSSIGKAIRSTRFGAQIAGAMLVVLLLTSSAFAQTGVSFYGQIVDQTGKPAPFSQVRVCAQTGGGSPCNPLSTIYSDPALTHQISNPVTTDSRGNYNVFVAQGYYILQFTVSGSGMYSYVASAAAGGTGGVNPGSSGQLPAYLANGSVVSPINIGSGLNLSGGVLTATGGSGSVPVGFGAQQFSNINASAFINGAVYNTDVYATGGGNNGIANAQASSNCTSGCTMINPPTSTDTEDVLNTLTKTGSHLIYYQFGQDFHFFLNPAVQQSTSPAAHTIDTFWNFQPNSSQVFSSVASSVGDTYTMPGINVSGAPTTHKSSSTAQIAVGRGLNFLRNDLQFCQNGSGDCGGDYLTQSVNTGQKAGSSEHALVMARDQVQGLYPTNGTVTSGGTGATTVTVHFANQPQEIMDGASIIVGSDIEAQGNILSVTTHAYPLENTYLTSDTHAVSTGKVFLTAPCGPSGGVQANTRNAPVSYTCAVTSSGGFGSISNGMVCVADSALYEQGQVTNVSGGNLTIGLTFPHPSGVAIYQGRPCGARVMMGYGLDPFGLAYASTYEVDGADDSTHLTINVTLLQNQQGQQKILVPPWSVNPTNPFIPGIVIPITSAVRTGTTVGLILASANGGVLNNFTPSAGTSICVSGVSDSSFNVCGITSITTVGQGGVLNYTQGSGSASGTGGVIMIASTGAPTTNSLANYKAPCGAEVTAVLSTNVAAVETGNVSLNLEPNDCLLSGATGVQEPAFYAQQFALFRESSTASTLPFGNVNGFNEIIVGGQAWSGSQLITIATTDNPNLSAYYGFGGTIMPWKYLTNLDAPINNWINSATPPLADNSGIGSFIKFGDFPANYPFSKYTFFDQSQSNHGGGDDLMTFDAGAETMNVHSTKSSAWIWTFDALFTTNGLINNFYIAQSPSTGFACLGFSGTCGLLDPKIEGAQTGGTDPNIFIDSTIKSSVVGGVIFRSPLSGLPTQYAGFDPAYGMGLFTAGSRTVALSQTFPGVMSVDTTAIGNGLGTLNAGAINVAGAAVCTTATGCTGGGVTSINGSPGAFTFSFSSGAGSCSGTTCTFTGSGSGGGSVTNFIAATGSWPTWLVPSVATSTTTPTLSVTPGIIPVANGGTGTATPSLVAGTNVTITGTWPNQTINASGGAVSSVSNSDGTLTISPTTGAVVASLALGHANTWTGLQTLVGTNITGLPLSTGVTGLLPHANIASTAVTPGSYTNANITVAADGSITAAANGSGGPSGISGQASGVIPLASTPTTIGAQSHINENTTGQDTFTQKVVVNDGTGNAGAFQPGVGTDAGGVAGSATYTTDATNGFAEVHEGTGALARICTSTNGQCSASFAFSALTGGTNASAAMLVGASLGPTGSGTVTATNATPAFTVNPAGSNNGTISFGANFGAPALLLFQDTITAANNYGWGLNGGEMQFFVGSSAGFEHFSFNKGGFQSTGVSEVARICANSSSNAFDIGNHNCGASQLLEIGASEQFTVDTSGNTKVPNLTDSALVSGNLVKAGAAGILTDTGVVASISNAITSATGGTGISAVTCSTAACTNLRGTYTMTATTVSAGTILTLVWPTTTTAYACQVIQNGGAISLGLGHSIATATGMTISIAVTAPLTGSITIDFECQP